MYGVNAGSSSGRRRTQRRKDRDRFLPRGTGSTNSGQGAVVVSEEATEPKVPLSSCANILLCYRIFYHCIRRVIFGESDGYGTLNTKHHLS